MTFPSKIKVFLAASLFAISLIIFTCLLMLVVIPEYNGSLFRFGTCRITNHTKDYDSDDVVWKDCSCGVLCTSDYPCSSVTGTFTPITDHQSERNGTFYSDYSALVRGCYKYPFIGECEKRPSANKNFIEKWTNRLPHKYKNHSFDCFGLGTNFFPFESNMYRASIGHLAFFPSLTFVILSFFLLYKSSERVRVSACCKQEEEDEGSERETGPLLRYDSEIERENSRYRRKSDQVDVGGEPSCPYYDNDEPPPPYQI